MSAPGSGDPTLTATVSTEDATLPAASTDAPARRELPVRDPARYRRAGEIARGGMGRIVLAYDAELERRVAIKELLSRSAGLERRFEREVRITSRLQHPSIIAVQDAGRWPDGAAFYTMQHVEGRALKEAIAGARTLADRIALVPHVLAVANAIAYAHGRSVIHRDLKPSNILVGAFGETIVIDWGLAKEVGDRDDDVSGADAARDVGATMLGQAIGTPAYMPPEQALGGQVDARADVYAIGAILYDVLAHAPPYADATSATDVVERVLAGPPRPLDELVPDAPADLRAIVAKAMARAPADRYPDAAALASDLRRFADGQLVGAHRYSIPQLVARWVARHRAAVAVAATAAVALAAVGVFAVQRIRAERDVAAAERRVAEGRRAEVEELLEFMLVDLHAKLEPIGKLDLLGMVADKAAGYYAERPLDAGDRAELERRALTAVRLGDIRVARGDLPGSLAAFREALDLFGRIDAPADRSNALEKIGTVLGRQGDLEGALGAFRESLALRERLAAATPDDATARRRVAAGHIKIGNVLGSRGDPTGAIDAYGAALAILERLAAAAPEDEDLARSLAVVHNKIGDARFVKDDLAGALAAYRAGLAIVERLAARAPDNPARQTDLSALLDNVASVLAQQGDRAGALAAYRASLAISERVAAHDPANTDWQRNVSIGQVNVANTLAELGQLDDALALYQAALAIRRPLAAQDPSNAEWQQDVAAALDHVAGIRQRQGRLDDALATLRESLAISERLARQDATNASWQYDVAAAHHKLGEIAEARHDAATARAEYRAALDIAERLAAAHPDVKEYAAAVAEVRASIAGVTAAR